MTSLLDRNSEASARFGPTPDEAKMLLGVAFRPSGVLLALVSAVVLVTLVTSSSDLTGTFGGLAATWLAVHQVPLGIAGANLSILPLLPTAVLVWSVASVSAKALSDRSSRRDVGWVVGAAVAGPLSMSAVMLAMIHDASTVIALSTPKALVTFGWVFAVHAVGVGIGALRGTWPAALRTVTLPPWVAASVGPAARAGAVILAGGSVLVALSLVLSWTALGELLESGGGVGGALGLTALSVVYLPNVILGAAAVLVGSTAHVGAASVGLFGTTGGQVPAVPVLAVLPESSAQVWWPVMLVVPLIAATLLGRSCAKATTTAIDAVRSAAAAAVGLSVAAVLLGLVAGGTVGTFGSLGVDVPLVGLFVFGWCLVIGCSVAAVTAYLMRRHEDHTWADDEDDRRLPDAADQPAALPASASDTIDADADADADADDAAETETVDAAVESDDPQPEPTPAVDEADVVDAEVVELDEAVSPDDSTSSPAAPGDPAPER